MPRAYSHSRSSQQRNQPVRVGLVAALLGYVSLVPIADGLVRSGRRQGPSGSTPSGRLWRVYSAWAFAAVFTGIILTFVGCRSFDSHREGGAESHRALNIRKIQSSTAEDGVHTPEALNSPGDDTAMFFETGKPLPHTLDIELDPSERESVSTYVLVTGDHGDDSLLRMPRAWTLYGSNDSATWVVLDRQADSRPWKSNEKRLYRLSSAARYKNFRIVFTQSGPTPILRIYRLRLYAN